jgi:hypothetical protein
LTCVFQTWLGQTYHAVQCNCTVQYNRTVQYKRKWVIKQGPNGFVTDISLVSLPKTSSGSTLVWCGYIGREINILFDSQENAENLPKMEIARGYVML